jgi:hypothetical protein
VVINANAHQDMLVKNVKPIKDNVLTIHAKIMVCVPKMVMADTIAYALQAIQV